jgi:hypothetical protein
MLLDEKFQDLQTATPSGAVYGLSQAVGSVAAITGFVARTRRKFLDRVGL